MDKFTLKFTALLPSSNWYKSETIQFYLDVFVLKKLKIIDDKDVPQECNQNYIIFLDYAIKIWH